jgi:hypothetical protein
MLMAGLATLVACSQEASKQTSNATPEQVARIEAAAPPPEPPKPVEPPKPKHYYSFHEDGEYGYEQGLSDDDEKAGKSTKPLVMIRYLGASDGVQSIQIGDGPGRFVLSCTEPCEFVKSRSFYAGSSVKGETVRATAGSVIWAVLQDAQHGELTPFQRQPKPSSGVESM